MKNMAVAIIGPSGSGKDTQAEFVEKEFGIKHFSVGQLFRDIKNRGDAIAKEAMEYVTAGKWVPDEITIKVVKDYIERECPDGFVMTGFPRTVDQFLMFDDVLKDLDLDWTAVVHMDLSREESLNRMVKQAKEAEEAGNPRPDATRELMNKRLDSYYETINPILQECKERGILLNIDASPSIEKVKDDLLSELKKLV
jgi:adenylate kinase